jgi:hypothetical protein
MVGLEQKKKPGSNLFTFFKIVFQKMVIANYSSGNVLPVPGHCHYPFGTINYPSISWEQVLPYPEFGNIKKRSEIFPA